MQGHVGAQVEEDDDEEEQRKKEGRPVEFGRGFGKGRAATLGGLRSHDVQGNVQANTLRRQAHALPNTTTQGGAYPSPAPLSESSTACSRAARDSRSA